MGRVTTIGITKGINKKKIMKNKTAMQELLEWIRKTLPMDLDTPQMIESKIESLLEKEKEQIREAYYRGVRDEWEGAGRDFEDYYNEKYANDTTTGLPEENSKRRGWHY